MAQKKQHTGGGSLRTLRCSRVTSFCRGFAQLVGQVTSASLLVTSSNKKLLVTSASLLVTSRICVFSVLELNLYPAIHGLGEDNANVCAGAPSAIISNLTKSEPCTPC